MFQLCLSFLSQLLGRREACYRRKELIAYQLCEQTQTYLASVNCAKSRKHQSSNLMIYFLWSQVLFTINVIWNTTCETVVQKRNKKRMWLYMKPVPCRRANTFKIFISVESWPQALHQSALQFVMCSIWSSRYLMGNIPSENIWFGALHRESCSCFNHISQKLNTQQFWWQTPLIRNSCAFTETVTAQRVLY